MCNSAVDVALQKAGQGLRKESFLSEHTQDPDGRRLRFSALQSEVGQQLLVFCGRRAEDRESRSRLDGDCTGSVPCIGHGEDLSSMMVIKPNGECLSQSDAVVFAAS